MKSKNQLLLVLIAAGFAQSVQAVPVIFDHFDDGSLDTNWEVSFENADGWTYEEAGTNLKVTDISNTVFNEALNNIHIGWSTVTLNQSFTALSDFQLDFDFSWDSESSTQPEQFVGINLLDTDGNSVAYAAYQDAWVSESGQSVARIGDTTYRSGAGSMPLSGSAAVDILRDGDSIDILWDGNNILSGLLATPITDVEVVFGYYANLGWNGTLSFFGNESVDLVNLQATTVPAPAAIWLIAPFALAMLRKNNRRV